MDSSTPTLPTLTNLGSGQWSIKVARSFKTVVKDGEVIVQAANESNAKSLPHAAVAGARAWLALANGFISQNEPQDAITCLQSGLKELGDQYAAPTDVDDTTLKLAAIEAQISKGNLQDAAGAMQRILDSRISMYAKTHADQIVK